jgi:hypothetical protein
LSVSQDRLPAVHPEEAGEEASGAHPIARAPVRAAKAAKKAPTDDRPTAPPPPDLVVTPERMLTPVAGTPRVSDPSRIDTPFGGLPKVNPKADYDRHATPVAGTPRAQTNTMRPEFDMESYARDSDKSLAPAEPAEPVDEDAQAAYDAVALSSIPPPLGFFELSETDSGWDAQPAEPEPTPAAEPEKPLDPNELLSLDAIIVSTVGPQELRALPLDPRLMFVLTQLDGSTDLGTVLEMSGIPPEEALSALEALAKQGVIIRLS